MHLMRLSALSFRSRASWKISGFNTHAFYLLSLLWPFEADGIQSSVCHRRLLQLRCWPNGCQDGICLWTNRSTHIRRCSEGIWGSSHQKKGLQTIEGIVRSQTIAATLVRTPFQLPLKKLGLKHIIANYSIFITPEGLNGPILSTFIDDIKIMRF